jgi:hypothetical protein
MLLPYQYSIHAGARLEELGCDFGPIAADCHLFGI